MSGTKPKKDEGWLDRLWNKFSKKAEKSATEAVTDTATGFFGGLLGFMLKAAMWVVAIGGLAALAKNFFGNNNESASKEVDTNSQADSPKAGKEGAVEHTHKNGERHTHIIEGEHREVRDKTLRLGNTEENRNARETWVKLQEEWKQKHSDDKRILHTKPLSEDGGEVKITSGTTLNRDGKPHDGIDATTKDHSRRNAVGVLASAEGVVLFKGQQNGYGNTIIVGHGDGTVTLYAHLKYDSEYGQTQVGDIVKNGEEIAHMGKSGKTNDIHLHYEQRRVNSIDNKGTAQTTVLTPEIEGYLADLSRENIKKQAKKQGNPAKEFIVSDNDSQIMGCATITCAPQKVAMLEENSAALANDNAPNQAQQTPPTATVDPPSAIRTKG